MMQGARCKLLMTIRLGGLDVLQNHEINITLGKRQSSSYKQWLISSCSVKNRGVVVVVSWCRGVEFCVWCLLSAVYACFQLGLIWFGSDFRFNRELFRKISPPETLRDS